MTSDEGELVFASAERSHPGNHRILNEDAAIVSPPVFAVADGMGGHQAGEVASSITAEVLAGFGREGPHDADGLRRALALANARIREETGGGSDGAAGTTAVGIVLAPGEVFAFNVGDSRLYSYVSGRLEQLSKDHSAVQDLIDAGVITPAEAARHAQRNVITRAVGVDPEVEVDVWPLKIEVGRRLVLASDGLTGELDDAGIADLLERHDDADAAAEALVAAALDAGGRDNVTVVVVDIVDRGSGIAGADDDTEPRDRRRSGDTTERRRRDGLVEPNDELISLNDVLRAGSTDE